MVTRLADAVDTAQRRGDATNRAWIQGESGDLDLHFRDSDGNDIDLTGYTITCATRYYLGSVEESGTGTSDDPLTATISDLERITTKADGTLTVTLNSDPTTGLAKVAIPETLYTDAISPNLTTGVPIVGLFFTFNASGGGKRKFRHLIYIRDGGP